MSKFDPLWKFVCERSQRGVMTVQNQEELEHVYNLTRDCKSYLEIGTAEGNTLHVLGSGMEKIVCVDLCEVHTKQAREEVQKGALIIAGNCHARETISSAKSNGRYDFVLIDAGHTFSDVLADAFAYADMADKYILFHDVQLKEVNAAFEWYVAQNNFKEVYKFINSENFGYGIVKL